MCEWCRDRPPGAEDARWAPRCRRVRPKAYIHRSNAYQTAETKIVRWQHKPQYNAYIDGTRRISGVMWYGRENWHRIRWRTDHIHITTMTTSRWQQSYNIVKYGCVAAAHEQLRASVLCGTQHIVKVSVTSDDNIRFVCDFCNVFTDEYRKRYVSRSRTLVRIGTESTLIACNRNRMLEPKRILSAHQTNSLESRDQNLSCSWT